MKVFFCAGMALLGAAGYARAQTPTTVGILSASMAGPTAITQGADGYFYGLAGAETTPTTIGSIFQMTPTGTITTLFSLANFNPVSIFQASDGNFYGSAPYSDHPFFGIIYKMTPTGTVTALYGFSGPDGANPTPGLIMGTDGNFYGTTQQGGNSVPQLPAGLGTIFKLTPSGTLTTLHAFQGPDGATPTAGVIQASDGNLYGTTQNGGTGNCQPSFAPKGCGTIFEVTPDGSFTTLYSFQGQEGSTPYAGLIQATDGNLYGTTLAGGESGTCTGGCGTVFKITPAGVLSIVHSFSVTDGARPQTAVIQASDGNLYGTAALGGAGGCQGGNAIPGCGTIFKLTLGGALTTLYSFPPETGGTRFSPGPGSLIQAFNGDLYGTVEVGGDTGNGIVYDLALGLPALTLTPAIAPDGIVNGASFSAGITPGGWLTVKGTNLASKTDTWNNSIVNGALPTTLDGVSVQVGGQKAYIAYISPTQINALAPSVPAGPVAVTVANAGITSQPVMATAQAEQPAFFQWGTFAVATRQDFSLAVKNGTFAGTTTVPAKPGDVIILWGTGFGATSPASPAGMQTPSTTTYNTASAVSVTVGGKPATVYGAALASGYAGLYQVAIQIPAGLANGDYPVVATINGVSSPSTTMITVQQ